MQMIRWAAGALLAVSLLAAGCQSVQTTGTGAIGVDRTQRMSTMISEADLERQAALAYREELGKVRQKGALNTDAAMTSRVRAISNRLIRVSTAFRPDAANWKWEVNLIQSGQVNAWCMPGGKIAVYSGLITKLGLSDDELAAVLGHEIAHALREHARERASEQMAAQTAISVGAILLGGGQTSMDLGGVFYDTFFGLPNSRLHETEADRIGVELAARAGYDPRAAITLWQKMARDSNGGGPEFLSTHPSAETRTRDLAVYAARVIPLYEQARRQ